MQSKKSILLLSALLLIFIAALFVKHRIQTRVNDLFRLNKTLQEAGYYMAEFEFKMLGMVYHLDKGHYARALSMLSRFHSELSRRENLIKLPEFKTTQAEMDFYLSLQNPRTGAFMDDTFPYCTFNEPTENVVMHLDALAQRLGVPLQLKYPLKYPDEINTPEKLRVFLDDVAYVGWLGSRFPETTFVFARSLLSFLDDAEPIGRNQLYHFSDAWKTALLEWFYANQDTATGYWGPRSRSNGRLLTIDLNNTASVIKAFVDKNGNNRHEAFPLKYRDRIFRTTLALLSASPPADDALDEWHAWNLSMNKGIKMLLRYLWQDTSAENRQNARRLIQQYVKIRFEKFYIPDEGAFSYYPHAEHASLDGTGGLILNDLGAFSWKKQQKLWRDQNYMHDLGRFPTAALSRKDLDLIINPGINSLRVYSIPPADTNLTGAVMWLVYPARTPVPDIMELIPRMISWLDTVSSSMGNWTSREALKQEYVAFNIKEPRIFRETVPLDLLNTALAKQKELYLIGFDILQIPRYRIAFSYSPAAN